MFYVLFMCKCVLPPGVNPTAVDKYIKQYIKYENDKHVKQTKLFLVLNMHRANDTYEITGLVPCMRTFSVAGRWMTNVTPRPLYAPHIRVRRLGPSHGWCGRC
jgi:hypothetical protein